jgi:hypothetical protein
MLTEQTNVPINLRPPASPFGIAKRVLEAAVASRERGHHLLEWPI